MCKLTKQFSTENESFEIVIDWDPEEETIDDIISVKVTTGSRTIDVSDLFRFSGLKKYFDDMVDDTDWMEIYRDLKYHQDKAFGKLHRYDHVQHS